MKVKAHCASAGQSNAEQFCLCEIVKHLGSSSSNSVFNLDRPKTPFGGELCSPTQEITRTLRSARLGAACRSLHTEMADPQISNKSDLMALESDFGQTLTGTELI